MKNLIIILLAVVAMACKKEDVSPSKSYQHQRDNIILNGDNYRLMQSDFTGNSSWQSGQRFYSVDGSIFDSAGIYQAKTSERIKLVANLNYNFPYEISVTGIINGAPKNSILIPARSGNQNNISVVGVYDLSPGDQLTVQINFSKSKENLILYREFNNDKSYIHFGKP